MEINAEAGALKRYNQVFETPVFLDKAYLPSLDGWRAVAIMFVILGHAKQTKGVTASTYIFLDTFIYAELGVKIFFVLSGFLITTLLVKEYQRNRAINLRSFYLRRMLRVFPVFYLYLVVIFILNVVLQLNLNWQNFIGAGLYINNFDFLADTWLTGHSWSLAVEEQFYIIWPLLFLCTPKKTWIYCIILILIIPLFKILWYFKHDWYQVTLGPFTSHADSIMVGCLAALLSFKGIIKTSNNFWKIKSYCGISIVGILVTCYCLNRGYFGLFFYPLGNTICNILIGVLIIHTIINENSGISKFLNNRLIRKLGVLSYSLYIWQQVFLIPSNSYKNQLDWSPFPYNIILAFAAAYLSYNFYEVHFLRLKKKRLTSHNSKENEKKPVYQLADLTIISPL